MTLYLEYISGKNLAHYADKHSMSQLSKNKQNQILIDISHGLQFMHNRKIIHRDIKPENIILGEDARGAVLCDFGISSQSSVCQPNFNGGTPCYIPPEYTIGERSYPGDIWAFGVTMLFVVGILPKPKGTWIIADVRKGGQAYNEMTKWLDEIEDIRKRLSGKYKLFRNMLVDDAHTRVTASELVSQLQSLKLTSSRPLPSKTIQSILH